MCHLQTRKFGIQYCWQYRCNISTIEVGPIWTPGGHQQIHIQICFLTHRQQCIAACFPNTIQINWGRGLQLLLVLVWRWGLCASICQMLHWHRGICPEWYFPLSTIFWSNQRYTRAGESWSPLSDKQLADQKLYCWPDYRAVWGQLKKFTLHFRTLGTWEHKKLKFANILTFTFGDSPPPLKFPNPKTFRFLPGMNDGDSKSNEL